MSTRRQRIHELVLALLALRGDLGLLEGDGTGPGSTLGGAGKDPGGWLERNRRVVQHYQALVRSAVTLDALIDQEVGGDRLGHGQLSGEPPLDQRSGPPGTFGADQT